MAEAVASVLVDAAIAVIKKQVSYFLFYRRHVAKLAIQVRNLESVTQHVRQLVEAEIRNGNEIRAEVRLWLEDVEDIMKKAKLVLENPNQARARCSCRSLFPDLGSRHRLGKKASVLAIYTANFLDSFANFHGVVESKGILNLESRESLMNEIMKALRDPIVSRVGVYGLAGVGKTTLVKQLAQQVGFGKLFDVVIMTSLSETSDIKVIQDQIAEMLGLRLEEVSEAGRARRLNLRLKTEQNILIIVDDIWAKLDLEKKLGIPSVGEHKGCKLLITSRNQSVLGEMGTQKDFELQVLNGREMLRFYDVVGSEVVEDAILLRNIANVAAECAGFPDHAMTVALALRNKDIHSCKYALNQLERFNNKQKNEIIYSALELSYNQLESEEMKALFLLCGVLGASSFVGDLLNFGMGLGIFKHTNTVKEARTELHKMIGQLQEHCLLLEGDDTSDQVKMQHIVCEVADSIASRQKHIFMINWGAELKEWPSEDFLKRCTQIIIDGCYIQKLPERFDCPELKLFYLKSATNRLLELPDSFFLGMGGLQVLGLTCMNMSSLPTSLGSLIDLKTLSLDHCALQNMTGIGALKNLEILTLTNSSFTFSYEFEQLTNLRMLDLSHSRIELIPPKIVPKWYQLEELYTGNTFIKWEFEDSSMQNKNASLSELKLLNKLTDLEIKVPDTGVMPRDNILMLEELDRLKLAVGDEFECSEIKAGFSKTLKLQLGTSVQIEDWMKELMKKVDFLCLGETNGISNVHYQLNGEGLPLLNHLHVQNNATIEHIVNSIGDSRVPFPNLETMVLDNLSYLDGICHPLTFYSFSKLRVIRVKKCSLLQNLFSLSIPIGLRLVEIEVSECNSLKAIVADKSGSGVQFWQLRSLTLHHLPALFGFNSYDQTSQTEQKPLFNSEYSFPKLETVKLCSIKLRKIFDEDKISVSSSVKQLTSLILEDCSDLKYVFPSLMVKSLLKLNRLEISNCHMMEEIIKSTEEQADNREVMFPNLKILRLSSFSLKNIWDKKGQLSATSLRNLTSLILEDCDDLTFLFSSSMVGNLSNLNRLEISKCHKMEQILKATEEGRNRNEVLFPSLVEIIISDMENLKTLWQLHQPPASNSFCQLRKMVVKNCEKLVKIFSVGKSLERRNSSMAAQVEA